MDFQTKLPACGRLPMRKDPFDLEAIQWVRTQLGPGHEGFSDDTIRGMDAYRQHRNELAWTYAVDQATEEANPLNWPVRWQVALGVGVLLWAMACGAIVGRVIDHFGWFTG